MFTFISDDCRLVGDAYGDEADPGVVLLHGGGQTRHSWRRSCLALAEAGFFALSLDARGHGDSSWAQDGAYSLDVLADDLRRVCSELNRPVAIVGASLGGLTGIVAAGEPPFVACNALVLVDVIPRMDPEGSAAVRRFMRANPDGFEDLDEAADAVATYLPHRTRPESTDGLAKNLRLGRDGRFRWNWDPRFLEDDGASGQGARIEQALDKVSAPVLLVRGERSDLVRGAYLEDFSRRHPKVDIVEVGGARHMVAGDVNDEFSTAVVPFLARTTTRVFPVDQSGCRSLE